MKHYSHDHQSERDTSRPDNTVWPRMSIDGVDTDDAKNYLLGRYLSPSLASENGWYPSRHAVDNFLRIVIPAKTTKAGHVYWQARAVSKNVHIRYQTPKGPRHGALVHVLANPEDANNISPDVVIVEGPMDALAVAECGYDSIALMGMSPGELALTHLIKLVANRPTLIVLDNEPEAQSQAGLIAMRLASVGNKTRVQSLKGVKDLAAMKYKVRESWLDDTIQPGWRMNGK